MSEQQLMNDEAARSPTGEILDQAKTQATEPTSQTDGTETKTDSSTKSQSTEQTVETKPTDKPTEAKPAVPDKYEFKAPEGYQLDDKLIETITPIFKEAGLSQDVAQKLVDFHAKQMLDAAKGPQDAYAATRTEWQNKTKADFPGTALDTAKADIGRALNALPPEVAKGFREAMDLTGAGDHPAVFKAIHALSAFVTEGKHVAGAGPSKAGQIAPGKTDRPDIAHALYPNLP